MRAVTLLVALAACSSEPYNSSSTPLPDAAIAGLDIDTYFILSMSPCSAPEPEGCVMELGFCADGRYAHKLGDVITTGTYGDVYPDILLDTVAAFQFDLEGDFSDDRDGDTLGPWNPTTADTDADVRCAQ